MSRSASNRGTAAIEFGLCAPLLCGLLLAALDLADYAHAVQTTRAMTAEAARLSIIDPTLSGCEAPAEALRARSPAVAEPLLRAGTTLCIGRTTALGLTRVTVTAGQPVRLTLHALGLLPQHVVDTTVLTF